MVLRVVELHLRDEVDGLLEVHHVGAILARNDEFSLGTFVRGGSLVVHLADAPLVNDLGFIHELTTLDGLNQLEIGHCLSLLFGFIRQGQ